MDKMDESQKTLEISITAFTKEWFRVLKFTENKIGKIMLLDRPGSISRANGKTTQQTSRNPLFGIQNKQDISNKCQYV